MKNRTVSLIKAVSVGLFACSLVAGLAACGEKDPVQNAVLPDSQPPIAPWIADLTPTSTTVEWLSMGTGVTYNVYRSATRNGSYELIATTEDTSFTDETEGSDTKPSQASYYRITSVGPNGTETKATLPASQETMLFGDYVYVFSPEDDMAEVNRELDEIYLEQENSQFGEGRYAVMFKPDAVHTDGTHTSVADYKAVEVDLGFYTEVLGLGRMPTETTVGKVQIDANWLGVPGPTGDSNATCNFWRAVSNFTVDPQILNGQTKNTLWAVSQAAPMRRMQINGNLQLTTTTGTKNWGSGGYIADTVINTDSASQNATGIVSLNGQQQFYFRNVVAENFTGGQWNMVFQGVQSNISTPKDSGKTTVIDSTPLIREKPFLFLDENGDYKVFVPGLRTDASGLSWGEGKPNGGMGEGTVRDLAEFYIAKPLEDDDKTLNAALREGKSILFTPGIYRIDAPLIVSEKNTILLGIGLATIYNRLETESILITSEDSLDGISICGLILDAGTKGSPCLMRVGVSDTDAASAEAPILLSDIFFRVGGDLIGMAKTCVEINVDNTIADDFWVWRADHGSEVTWLKNLAENGLIVNGNDVTIYALMCEHFQEYETLWNGEGGRLYFYQSELPYDVIDQKSWIAPNGANGYASYKVADYVRTHEAWGLGVYSCFTRTGIPPEPPLSGYADGLVYVFCDNAIEVPNAPGVKIHNACTVFLAADDSIRNRPSIKNVINGYGGAIYTPVNRAFITEFCDPIDEQPVIRTAGGDEIETGKFTEPQEIVFETPYEDGEIFYTLDGTVPSRTNPSAVRFDGQPVTVGVEGKSIVVSVVVMRGESTSFVKQITIVVSQDLAVFQPTKASSFRSGNVGPSGAVNGITDKATGSSSTDRWQANSPENEWWAVDLGDEYYLSSLKITWDSTNSCAYDYKIYYATDEEAWTNPENLSLWTESAWGAEANRSQVNSFTASEEYLARYMLLVGGRTAFGYPSPPNNSYPFAMWGFEVYGSKQLVPAPVITVSPTDTNEKGQQKVTISATENAKIVYTLDGSVPTLLNGTQYEGPFYAGIAGSTISVRAIAVVEKETSLIAEQSITVAGVDLAQGRPSAASGEVSDDGHTADKAFNGTINASSGVDHDRWEVNSPEAWIMVDLGSIYDIQSVKLFWRNLSLAKGFEIYVSSDDSAWEDGDSAAWEKIYENKANSDDENTIVLSSPAAGRYVMLKCVTVKNASGYNGYSLREMQIFGSAKD